MVDGWLGYGPGHLQEEEIDVTLEMQLVETDEEIKLKQQEVGAVKAKLNELYAEYWSIQAQIEERDLKEKEK